MDLGQQVVDMDEWKSKVPHARLAPSFLASNAQAHRSPLFAMGDLVDNAREAGACHVTIVADKAAHRLLLADDGAGMDEAALRDALSLAYTRKDASTGRHYGMGLTAALPRLCERALILSRKSGGHATAGLLSRTLSDELVVDELITPQCTWEWHSTGQAILNHPIDGAPLDGAARRESLSLILAHTGLAESAVLAELDAIGPHGTRILLLNLTDDVEVEPPTAAATASSAPASALRTVCMLSTLVAATRPPIQLIHTQECSIAFFQ